MSPPASQSFKIPVKLRSGASLSDAVDKTRQHIFSNLGIKTIQYGDGVQSGGAANPLDVIEKFNLRLWTIINKCEQFANKNAITLIVSLNGGWTKETARLNLLSSLFIECEEAKLAAAAQKAIDDLKEAKRRADIEAQVAKEWKAVEDSLPIVLWHLARLDYCEVIPTFNKSSWRFEFVYIDRGQTGYRHPPLKEEEYLWEPDIQKNQIRGFLHSNLNSGFPWTFYFYKWHIYYDDPEDFESEEMEFQNLLDDRDISDSEDVNLGKRLHKERKEAYQKAIEAAGGVFSFAANLFFDHVLNKALYAVPVVGGVMMVYDLAQLATQLPDDVRTFSKIVLDEMDS